jgi:DNA-binding NtrC family response regulator
MACVLIVDDEATALRQMSESVMELGFATLTAASGEAALACLHGAARVDAVVLDLVMPDRDGLAVLEALQREAIGVPVIVAVARSEPAMLAAAANVGAVDFIEKPATPERLRFALAGALQRSRLEAALAAERRRRDGTPVFADFVAGEEVGQRALAIAARAARNTLPLLIEGETGTGRGFLARIVHASSERRDRPFVRVGDGDADLDAAWTAAAGGTLFVEEIGLLNATQQARLFALLDPANERTPARRARRSDARLVATSRCRLLELARQGRFREDLYYRLTAMPIYLPPLRDRAADLPDLAVRFATRFAAETGRPVRGVSTEALELLRRYDWPENLRQLEGAICRAVALAEDGLLRPPDFPHLLVALDGHDAAAAAIARVALPSGPVHIDAASQRFREAAAPFSAPDRFLTGHGISRLADVERNLIAFALAQCQGQMAHTARTLGIGRSTLYRKLREYGLDGGLDQDAA